GHVAVVNFLRVGRPEPIVRRHVENALHPLNGCCQGGGVSEVSANTLHRKPRQRAGLTARADQNARLVSLLDQQAGEVTTQKPAGARNQGNHSTLLISCAGAGEPALSEANGTLALLRRSFRSREFGAWLSWRDARAPGTRKLPLQELPGIGEGPICAQHGGRLVADVHHAMLAARVAPSTVFFPRGLLDEFLERAIMGVRNQVARTLPAARA